MTSLKDVVLDCNIVGGNWYSNDYDRFGDPVGSTRFNEGYAFLLPCTYYDVEFTFSLWIKVNAVGINPVILQCGNFKADDVVFKLGYFSTSIEIKIYNDETQKSYLTLPDNVLKIGKWHYFAFTVKGTTGYMYVDGVGYGSGPVLNPRFRSVSKNNFGRDPNLNGYLNASINDVKIYRGALSYNEIVEECFRTAPSLFLMILT